MYLSSHKITFYLLVLCIVAGFIQRYTDAINILIFICFFFTSCLIVISNINTNKNEILVKQNRAIIIPFFISLIIAILYNIIPNFVMEFLFIISFIIPLTLIPKIHINEKIKIVRYIVIFSVLQLFFDLLLPNTKYSDLDKYSGLFNSGNNKTRYLLFSVVVLIACWKNKDVFFKLFKSTNKKTLIIIGVPIIISVYLGHSAISLLFLMIAIASAIFIKKLRYFILINVASFSFVTYYIISNIQNWDNYNPLWWIYYRFYDPDNGIYAGYKYGLSLFQDSGYVGVGLGNFATRAAAFLKTKNAYGYPAINIVDANVDFTKYNSINYPDWGMDPFFMLFVEMGILAIPIVFIFYKKLWKYNAKNWVGSTLFFYVFYVANYWPQFLDNFYSYLYIATFMIINDVFRNTKHASINDGV